VEKRIADPPPEDGRQESEIGFTKGAGASMKVVSKTHTKSGISE
jgi:hypothetical protein